MAVLALDIYMDVHIFQFTVTCGKHRLLLFYPAVHEHDNVQYLTTIPLFLNRTNLVLPSSWLSGHQLTTLPAGVFDTLTTLFSL